MRSQITKPVPKKGSLNKTAVKGNSPTKVTKKKTLPTKATKAGNANKVGKKVKKASKEEDKGEKQESNEPSNKNDASNPSTAGPSKQTENKSESPNKKSKKEPKEKKDKAKSTENAKTQKSPKIIKRKPASKKKNEDNRENDDDDDEIKYKINLDVLGKISPKSSKGKTVAKKKSPTSCKKKIQTGNKTSSDIEVTNVEDQETKASDVTKEGHIFSENLKGNLTVEGKEGDKKNQEQSEKPKETKPEHSVLNSPTSSQPQTPKSECERPPKFFTSSRSPRTVDIDVKCFKNSKGNLSVSERLSLKFESKTDDNKEKSTCNSFVTQGPEIDVYTFTEKVDSPKSILSDFRNPINKNIGRVRPIARVKGTIIDKKSDTDRKKYSPHRPIEEVVKQLKASKQSSDPDPSSIVSALSPFNIQEKDDEEKPKPIVSKSYKMVARKSSVTGKPFSPLKFDQEQPSTNKLEAVKKTNSAKKSSQKAKRTQNISISDDDFDTCKFSFNTKNTNYTSSDESVSESNDDNDFKGTSGSDAPKTKRTKTKKFKRITDGAKKQTSKELKELSKDSLIDLKEASSLLGDKPSKRRLKLLSLWSGPKKHRMASLNAIAKVHCLYENESRTHMELGLMKTVDRQMMPSTSKATITKSKKEPKPRKEVSDKAETTSESEYENSRNTKDETSESSDDSPPQRSLRGEPGIRSAGKYWDPKSCSSSSEDSEHESKKQILITEKKKVTPKKTVKSDSKSDSESDKPSPKMKKTAGVPVKKKRNRNEVVMDLKDMVVQKRMASLNATAILAASYEKRSPKSSNRDDTTSDSCSDESFSHKSKNGVSSGFKSEVKKEEIITTAVTKKEVEESTMSDGKQKVEVIVNQDTDVTITGVYSTHHHEGFCTVSGMQYRISSTSHTQTTATANCEKQESCTGEEVARYTPLSALSSMQPPADHIHAHPHLVPELGGLARRPGCSSAFSAPSSTGHHEPGYYQPAGPLIKETGDAERALARYHPAPHYHAPHPPMIQQYGPPYYPPDLCYGRYYRPPGPYHMPPPQPDPQMVGVGSEPYSSQYYGTPPCYQHSPQRIPSYVEYRTCPCPLNACPKNVVIGPATGKAPTGSGPDVSQPGGSFRAHCLGACADATDTHGSGKDPPLELEPPAAADAPHPCPLPTIGGASPKREMFDVRDNVRLAGSRRGAGLAGPPSPARGSAGACAPQPPPGAPRRARLGKAMARESLARDDTAALLGAPGSRPGADDDVLPVSPPGPIDLSSSDERSPPLVDVKKENEGPTHAAPRKTDAQALKEHNSATGVTEVQTIIDSNRPVKRRFSRPKLEIDMKDVQLEESCKTNGIGEHVKLQKRRKVSGDQTETPKIETVTKELKKKTPQAAKRVPKTPASEKKPQKRRIDDCLNASQVKKMLLDSFVNEDPRFKNVAALPEEMKVMKITSKCKTAPVVLDNLLRKNSINRENSSAILEKNPAELFLTPKDLLVDEKIVPNINNNFVENSTSVKDGCTNIPSIDSQVLKKKYQNKHSCKVGKVDSKITHNSKSLLRPQVPIVVENSSVSDKCNSTEPNNRLICVEKSDIHASENHKIKCDITKDDRVDSIKNKTDKNIKTAKEKIKATLNKSEVTTQVENKVDDTPSIHKPVEITTPIEIVTPKNKDENDDKLAQKRNNLSGKANGEIKGKTVEKLVKLLASKRAAKLEESKEIIKSDNLEPLDITKKRCKLADNVAKSEKIEKVAKLLVSKKSAIKMDEATTVIEEACSSPPPSLRKVRRRRSGTHVRRLRRPLQLVSLPASEPRAPPRWSNGWNWDGEPYLSKVYLNNDSRLDRTAQCWARMTHASGDAVARGDCVLLRASAARAMPFVARVASLWENPDDGEMMVSLVWYYRPEHTESGRTPADAPDEVFASKHRDANSVACIEDKCYVLTFNEYCRYRKRLKATEEGITVQPSIVPPMPSSEVTPAIAPNDSKLPPSVSPELVLFCRKIYDFRSKKLQMPNK